MKAPADPLHAQRLLATSGFNPGPLDGIWGPKSQAAMDSFLARGREIRDAEGEVDSRSESEIGTLVPPAQIAARRFLHACLARGFDVRVISGTRTYAEQDALYAQGRTVPGDIVTNARGGQSNHNFGIAWDVGVWHAVAYQPDSPDYRAIASLRPPGVEWGGDWNSIKDRPHYQLATGLTVAQLRGRFEAGLAVVLGAKA